MSTTDADALAALGWDEEWKSVAAATGVAGAVGRVGRVDFGRVTVLTAAGSQFATPGDDGVATGDWVIIDGERVAAVLPRRSSFVRGDPMEGKALDEQVLAANLDIVLVVQSLTNGPNVRRLERELVLAYESGATPVIVLTKADEVTEADVDNAIDEIEGSATGVDIIVTSALAGTGMETMHALMHDNRTIAFIGASGVGKSTLVNALVGHDVQETGAVRESDQRGRHTTTARELILIPGGGVLIDTPGLRAVSLWDADEGLSRAFADIEALAARCKFRDCSHRVEPGCAVRAAIEAGELDEARFEHYLRLDAELDAAERRRHGRIMSKAVRQMYKDRPQKL
jgi:ribosome biogenesis GTPase / thiamine phosphate phosphatase